MDYATFATIVDKIEAGTPPVMELAEVMELLDVARQRRVTLSPIVAGYLNTIVGQAAPAGYEQFFEYDGSRMRVVLKRKGKKSSLENDET